MRLFLDAHVSARRIATSLRERRHEVRAADEERSLDGFDDEELLALAAADRRIMVTFNVRDFPRIAREWAESGRDHAGCLILVRIDHSEFGVVIRVLEAVLAKRSEEDWRNYTCFVSRQSADRPT